MNSSAHQRLTKAQHELAAGILGQARRDLRRFRSAKRALGRELYLDAHDWVMSEDCSWPLSFRNVCELLDLPPEQMREELLRDNSLGTADYWSRQCARLLRQCQDSLREIFSRDRYHNPAEARTLAHVIS